MQKDVAETGIGTFGSSRRGGGGRRNQPSSTKTTKTLIDMSLTTKLGLSALSALLVVLLAAWYQAHLSSPASTSSSPRLSAVLASLLEAESAESSAKTARSPRVAIGYGACRDLFVDARSLLGDSDVPDLPEHFNEVRDEGQMRKMFAYFFRHGAAAERFVSDVGVFDGLVEKAERCPEHRWALGGNAPVMATRFAREGADVLLAAKMTEETRRSIPDRIRLASSSSGSNVEKDDVHLILEYKRNEVWGQYTSPRANRFIVHSDVNNPTISSLEDFGSVLGEFNPDLLLVGGLQMMDNFPFAEGVRLHRLGKVRDQMRAQDFERTRVHFEMASFADESLLKELTEVVIPYADSLGMNEQELPNLFSMLRHGNVSYVSDSNPRIAVVLDEMREVFKMLTTAPYTKDGPRPLTRIHIHTLAYQAIMIKRNSAWTDIRLAAAKASLTANRHVCASEKIDLEKAFIIMDGSFATSARAGSRRIPFREDSAVSCWSEDDLDVEVCIAPNLVCSEAQQTAGGGDNISAAGLYPQI